MRRKGKRNRAKEKEYRLSRREYYSNYQREYRKTAKWDEVQAAYRSSGKARDALRKFRKKQTDRYCGIELLALSLQTGVL